MASLYLKETKNFRVETSSFDRNWGPFIPVADIPSFLLLCFRLLNVSAFNFSARVIPRWL
jgi:hypothetical protein